MPGDFVITIIYIYNNNEFTVNKSKIMVEHPEGPDRTAASATGTGSGRGPSGPEGAQERSERPRIERPVRKIRKNRDAGTGRESRRLKRPAEERTEEREEERDKEREEERDGEREEERDKDHEGNKKKESPRKVAIGILKDVAISGSIVGVLLLGLYLFSGVWPPMVVIESSSMMHESDSQIGVIDTGDLTLVQKVDERSDSVTYVEATCRTNPNYGIKEYGDYGNVIVYRKNGKAETPVIHRAIAWIEYNASASDPSRRLFRGDLPDIRVYNVSEYYVNVTSYRSENYLRRERMVIQISAIFAATTTSPVPHSGFVTKGDHNIPYVDQWVLYLQGGVRVEPVKMEWIVGKAQGELPWFGLFKLWITGHDSKAFPQSSVQSLIGTVIVLVIVPIIIDYVIARWKKKKETRREARKEIKKLRFR